VNCFSPKPYVRYIALGFVLAFTSACAVFAPEPEHAACIPDFLLKDGWLGGDSVSSIDLGEGRTLWLFGDSFVGSPTDADRTHAKMIANSVGLSSCGASGWSIAYDWQDAPNGPSEIFSSKRVGEKYWPLSGVMLENGEALVILARVKTVKEGDPFGFRIEGADLAYLRPTQSTPDQWPMTIEPLHAGSEWIIGSAAVRASDSILVLAARQAPSKDGNAMALLRLAGHPHAYTLEAFAQGAWQKLSDAEPQKLFPDGSSEAGLLADSESNWLLVHSQGGLAAPQVMLRVAKKAAGPWSPAEAIARYPEMTREDRRYRSSAFCYAAKVHSQFSNETTLFVTYACNTADLNELQRDLSIYRPRIISIPRAGTRIPGQ
jgi:hypothetical protein